MRRWYVIGAPYIWLLLFFLVPFFIVFKISLSDIATAIPPYTPTLDLAAGWEGIKSFFSELDFENYAFIINDPLYVNAYWSSVTIA
nr:ABC transporter permease [Hyphomicrobium sp.]